VRSRSFSLLQWDRLTNPDLSGRARDREEAVLNIGFDDEMGRIQREIAESHDLVVRRKIFMDALNLRTGEKVLVDRR
jgi:hypothetical protein